MMIQEVAKKQGFSLSRKWIFEKNYKGEGKSQIDPPTPFDSLPAPGE